MDPRVHSKGCPQDLNIDTCNQRDLRKSMGLSKAQFDLFKAIVKDTALNTLPCVARTRQKPEDWNTFIQIANSRLTHLGTYTGDWHLYSYFYILKRNPGFQQEWKQKRSEMATHNPGSSSRRKKKIQYVGKPPPRRRTFSSWGSHSTVGETSSQAVTCVGSHPAATPPPLRLGDVYPAPCTVCGSCESISPSHTGRLQQLFSNAEDLRSSLRYTGVLHDRHLCMILNWSRADRVAFINAVHPDRIKTTDRRMLAKLLTGNFRTLSVSTSTAPVDSPSKARREREYDPIPKPSLEVELRITSGQAPLSELMQAMTLQDEQEFDGILQTIDGLYEENEANLVEADDQFWITFFHKVYSRWPVMRLYQGSGFEDNNWAIKFYVRRKLQAGVLSKVDYQGARGIGETNGHASATRHRSSSPGANSIHNSDGSGTNVYPYPGITLSTCPIHPPPDYRLAGPRLRHLLESHGAEELLPVFVTVGVKSDEALNKLSMLAKQDRIKEFTNERRRIHLTDLQKFTLELILNKLQPD